MGKGLPSTVLLILAFAAQALAASSSHSETAARAAQAAPETATHLVSLTRPHEREARAIRFMVAVAPMALPGGLADCMVAKTTPTLKNYFASLYASQLSEEELRQAVDFYQSDDGQAAVTLSLQHEEKIFAAAAKGEQVTELHPVYPTATQKALDAFGATPAGKKLEDLAARDTYRTEISDLRSRAMDQCLADLLPAGK